MQLPSNRWQELPTGWESNIDAARDQMDWADNNDELRRIDRQAKWLAVAAVVSGVALVVGASMAAWWMI